MNNPKIHRRHDAGASPADQTQAARPSRPLNRRRAESFRNRRELAESVFAERDPVIVGCELLGSESESVKLHAWQTLVAFYLDKPEPASGEAAGPRINWDLPGPAREASNDPQPQQN